MLVPTTVGMLQAPGGGLASSGDEPNLSDSLACVYYLRAIKALAFAEALDDTMRLDMYRTMVSSVSDARHRVALEAMQCLLNHPRCVRVCHTFISLWSGFIGVVPCDYQARGRVFVFVFFSFSQEFFVFRSGLSCENIVDVPHYYYGGP